ncbi:MAG: hypothetical protein GTO63_15555 [Anaerolineae bacterium]|nr:hypothetical protein [Anaerolineae bacterium]NIN96245.1 hypothetical protein [Anaerolineae bacterium]NIQ79265.1 hypothetical protein [Anaerolineae bacterium]
MDTQDVSLEGVTYVCPPPDYQLRELATAILAGEPSREELSYILAWVAERARRETLLSVERFVIERI